MRRRLQYFVLLAGLLWLGACATSETAAPNQSLTIPDSTTSITAGDLRIGPMDMLEVTVFGVSELNGTYQVDFTGQMKLPLIGEVRAVGYNSSELAEELERLYGETYLQNPDVTVRIAESIGRRVTVEGSVKNPGLFPVQGQLSLLQAVALAGGPTDGANPRKVVVFRQIENERRAAAFDLVAIRNGNADDPLIYGNDIVVMDGSEARRTYGEILRSIPLVALFLAF